MLLDVRGVSAGYGQVTVLRSISVGVNSGECVGMFGPNGHGKTTLLRTISGLIHPREGTILFDDADVTKAAPREIVSSGLVHVPQGSTAFPRMTVGENLLLGAYSKRAWRDRAETLSRVLGTFPRLRERSKQLARTLSGGERQMLSIGMGLMALPRLLMLDEPTLGLAPKIKEELGRAIAAIASDGVSLLVVDQDVELLFELCRRLYLVERGQVALETQPGQRISEEDVLERYFGKAVK